MSQKAAQPFDHVLERFACQARCPDIHISIDVAHAQIGKIGFSVSLDEPFAEVARLPHQRRDRRLGQTAFVSQPSLILVANLAGEALRFVCSRRSRRPFRQSRAQQSVNPRPRYRCPAGPRCAPAILLKLPDRVAQIFGDKIRRDIAQVNRPLLQISEELICVEAIVVNDSWAISLPAQRDAKF